MVSQLNLLWQVGRSKRYARQSTVPFEREEQKRLVAWLKENGIKHYAVPNGGYRSKPEASRMRLEGVSAGVPDLCIPVPIKPYHGLYIELKRVSGGRASEEQVSWINYLSSVGYRAEVCKGHQEAINLIKVYFSMMERP